MDKVYLVWGTKKDDAAHKEAEDWLLGVTEDKEEAIEFIKDHVAQSQHKDKFHEINDIERRLAISMTIWLGNPIYAVGTGTGDIENDPEDYAEYLFIMEVPMDAKKEEM